MFDSDGFHRFEKLMRRGESRNALAVLECGGGDTAFDSMISVKASRAVSECHGHPESGVALRLPPQSRTLTRQSRSCRSPNRTTMRGRQARSCHSIFRQRGGRRDFDWELAHIKTQGTAPLLI